MKSLYLLRHAKSDWSDFSLEDHARPLNPRGRRAARLMGDYMSNDGRLPDVILCSTSRRTRETLDLLFEAGEFECPVGYSDSLYEAGSSILLDLVRQTPDSHKTLMMIGHNPGFHHLAMQLAASGPPAALARLRKKLPTGSLIDLTLDIEYFRHIVPGAGRLERFIRPKALAKQKNALAQDDDLAD